MSRKLAFLITLGVLLLFLGCGREQESKSQSESVLEKKTFEQLTEEDWEEIRLSKREFNLLLAGLVEQYGEMEIPLESAGMFGHKIQITLGNSDGRTNANKQFARSLEETVRRFYEHSEYANEQQPTITVQDQSGTLIE